MLSRMNPVPKLLTVLHHNHLKFANTDIESPCSYLGDLFLHLKDAKIAYSRLLLHIFHNEFLQSDLLTGDIDTIIIPELTLEEFKNEGLFTSHCLEHKDNESRLTNNIQCTMDLGSENSFSLETFAVSNNRNPEVDKCFKCEFCDKVFTLRSRLSKHLPVHSTKTIFCEYCPASFKRKQDLFNINILFYC